MRIQSIHAVGLMRLGQRLEAERGFKTMNIILDTLLAFVVLVLAWRCWKKTARAFVRDRLFDLRDELRNHYVENGLDMNDGAYAKIRELINCQLRYAKDMRMIGYLYFSAHVSDEMVRTAASAFDETIRKCDAKTAELVARIRRQACEAILLYMAATSLGFISAAIVMFIYFLPAKIELAIKKCASSLFEFKPATLEYAVMC